MKLDLSIILICVLLILILLNIAMCIYTSQKIDRVINILKNCNTRLGLIRMLFNSHYGLGGDINDRLPSQMLSLYQGYSIELAKNIMNLR